MNALPAMPRLHRDRVRVQVIDFYGLAACFTGTMVRYIGFARICSFRYRATLLHKHFDCQECTNACFGHTPPESTFRLFCILVVHPKPETLWAFFALMATALFRQFAMTIKYVIQRVTCCP